MKVLTHAGICCVLCIFGLIEGGAGAAEPEQKKAALEQQGDRHSED